MYRQVSVDKVRAESIWGVLLAGGDGTRLQALTARIEGDGRPKQFCRVLGEESLFSQTCRRIRPLFGPDRVMASVTRKHEHFYARELHDLPESAVMAQPENRGTGVAIALAVLKLRDLDPEAMVVALPCDHHYGDEAAFLGVIEAGIEAAGNHPDAIVLVGAEATYPEMEYGWIEPVEALANAAHLASARVRRFWEKPSLATAHELHRRGCLWNTFVMVGRVGAFLDVLSEVAADAMQALSEGLVEDDLDAAYRVIRPLDFSRDVLAGQAERLLVIRDGVSGWTDVGNPRRVFDTLAREGIAPEWLEAMRRESRTHAW